MFRRFLLSAFAALLLLAVTGCEDPEQEFNFEGFHEQLAIIGGEVDEDDQYLPVVAIYFQVTLASGGLCTGTVVNNEWVLTAAHCPVDGYQMGASRVFFGHDMFDPDVVKVGFDDVQIHPDYGYDFGVPFNDVAVIHLEEPLPAGIEPIPINRETLDDDVIGEEFTFVGFGNTTEDPDAQPDGLKRHVDVAVADIYPFDFDVFYYQDASKGTAHGDSGGPALYDFGDGPRVTGVTSWGWGEYGVSMSVDALAEWIDGYTGGDSPPGDDDTGDDDDSAGDDDDADDDSADDDDDDGQTCQCRTGDAAATVPALLGALAAAGLLLRRRRS